MSDNDTIKRRPRVLVVDDDEFVRDALNTFLVREGCETTEAVDGQNASEILGQKEFDVVVTDVNMPRKDGMQLLAEIRETRPALPVIIITGRPAVEAAVECMRQGAFDYLPKPFDFFMLRDRVHKAAEQRQELQKQSEAGVSPFLNINHQRYFKHYRLLRILGEGSVGLVFLAERTDQPDNPHKFALKVLKSGSGHGQQERTRQAERFLNEGRAAVQVRNQHVIQVIEYGVTPEEQIPFLVMEYYEGHSLKYWTTRHQELDYLRKARLLRQIADALDAIHAHGITHRDIKPHNIMVNDRFQVRVTDFGIARLPNSELTMTSELMGSPAYLAPEAFETSNPGPRADLFSLGVVAYELCLGRKPFEADSIPRFAYMIQKTKPIEPRKIDPNFPPRLQRILARMLKKSPADRYQEAAAVVADLDRFLERPNVANAETVSRRVSSGEDWEQAG